MRTQVMLDLETMGTNPGSAIIAVGAVKFNREEVLDDKFYRVITLKSAMEAGLTCDPETIMFWMRQEEAARSQFNKVAAMPLATVLAHFTEWVGQNPVIWGNGSDFDNVLLADAYRAVKMPVPWKFWDNRCYRTYKNILPDVKMEREGTYHNALDDAMSQAKHLLRIQNKLCVA